MGVRVEWRGDELRESVRSATITAVDELDEAVAEAARGDHPGWTSRTGEAEASIKAVPAQSIATGVRGSVGFQIARGHFLEFEARGHPGDRTISRAMERLGFGFADRIRRHIDE